LIGDRRDTVSPLLKTNKQKFDVLFFYASAGQLKKYLTKMSMHIKSRIKIRFIFNAEKLL
jgi:hypothetical protein